MAIPKLNHIPGWERPFLMAIRNGQTEQVAAALSGIGVNIVKQRAEKDEGFRKRYQEEWDRRKSRPAVGLF